MLNVSNNTLCLSDFIQFCFLMLNIQRAHLNHRRVVVENTKRQTRELN